MGFKSHRDHSGCFPRCVCDRYDRFCVPRHNLNPVHFCIKWRIYVAELCSLVSPIARICIVTMHPMDAQRYDLSKRSSVSL